MTLLEKQILFAAKKEPKSLPKGLKELKAETAREVIKELYAFVPGNGELWDLNDFKELVEKKYPQVKP